MNLWYTLYTKDKFFISAASGAVRMEFQTMEKAL